MADKTKKTYTPSPEVVQAEKDYQAAEKPGAYASRWEKLLAEALEKLQSRQPFAYSLNGDALYRQYKNRAEESGKRAMEDTMAQAAALTGGYGNSYAQSVGQQAYQNALGALGDKIPELYALALEQYDRQGQQLQNRYGQLLDLENRDYARYRDNVQDGMNRENQLWNRYNSLKAQDYTAWENALEREYQAIRDSVEDAQWQAQFDEARRRYADSWALKHPAQSAVYGAAQKSTIPTAKREIASAKQAAAGAAKALGEKKKGQMQLPALPGGKRLTMG